MAASSAAAGETRPQTAPQVAEKVLVDKVWPGHPVGFALVTHKGHQFVAYYDAKRQMTVARRRLGEKKWEHKRLPSRVGWDSHNYITITFDRADCLHVSGNMHNNPLVYFRAAKPLDIASLEQHRKMTGDREGGVTYPQFIRDNEGRLLFMYRHGSSGNGLRLINAYDEKSRTWKRLLKTPLLDGRKQSMNAYPAGSIRKGPDGRFHVVWVWRDTPDCRTNHDISYARSADMLNWETAAGKPVTLPITPLNRDVIVDPIPTRKGLINISYGLGFDQQNRPVVHYHNYDKNGNSQIFLARHEAG
ncbi:MAG: BNR repeat-containing protein, partial [Planctomycetota bacterium]